MTFEDVIKDSILNGFNSDISTADILVVLGISLILGLYVYEVYRLKSKSTFYSKDFNNTLACLPIVTSGIVLAMQSSVVISLGMVGALSIVRFRNAIKSSLDLLFLFWSISIGIICGAGIFDIALIMSLVITILLFTLDLIPNKKASLLLVVNAKDVNAEDEIRTTVNKYAKSNIKSKNLNNSGIDMIFEIRTKNEKQLVNDLSTIEGVLNINLLAHDGERKF